MRSRRRRARSASGVTLDSSGSSSIQVCLTTVACSSSFFFFSPNSAPCTRARAHERPQLAFLELEMIGSEEKSGRPCTWSYVRGTLCRRDESYASASRRGGVRDACLRFFGGLRNGFFVVVFDVCVHTNARLWATEVWVEGGLRRNSQPTTASWQARGSSTRPAAAAAVAAVPATQERGMKNEGGDGGRCAPSQGGSAAMRSVGPR